VRKAQINIIRFTVAAFCVRRIHSPSASASPTAASGTGADSVQIQLRLAVSQKHILRLQIAVNYIVFVKVSKCCENGVHHGASGGFANSMWEFLQHAF
jgi:hypothetical protein